MAAETVTVASQPSTDALAPAAASDGGRISADDGKEPAAYAVHLASYRKLANLHRGWKILVRENPEYLFGLRPDIATVDLGPGKGMYYRLKAGPLPSRDLADRLCRQLKKRRLYCVVMRFTG